MKPTPLAKLVLLLASVSLLAASAGCVAVVAGASADATLNASLDKSVAATNKAIEQRQFAQVSENKDALQVIIIARNAAGKKIELPLKRAATHSPS